MVKDRQKRSAHTRCPYFSPSPLQLAPAFFLSSRTFLSPSLIYLLKFNCPLMTYLLLLHYYYCVCVHTPACVCICFLSMWVPEDVRSPEAGVPGSDEPFDLSSGN